MLQLRNETPFAAQLLLLPDTDGVDALFAIVKGTFVAEPTGLSLADEQVPIALADEHHGDPATSSIRTASDVCLVKPGTDVVLLGNACASGDRPTWQMDVSLAVGPVAKTVRVFGDRVWETGPAGASMSWVAPFVRMPLVWERAFGGRDETEKGPAADPRNPVGVGFRASRSSKALGGTPLPNVEDPAVPITSWKDAPPPAGLAPLAAHWEPRKSFAGTYDEAWERQRAPYLPADFDPRFFQIAPAGLVAAGHLRGGEVVDVRGATPDGVLRFLLPELHVEATFRLDAATRTRPAALDTVILAPEARRVTMVWRAALRCDKQALKVREVSVAARAAN